MDSWTRFAEAVFHLNGLMIAAGENITGPIGQTSARWQVLGGLCYGPKTVADIARSIGHARQSVQRVADALIEDGLVARRDKPDDRRTMLLELTQKGKKTLGAIYERQVEWSDRVTGQLTATKFDALAAALTRIGDVIETDIKANGPDPETAGPATTKECTMGRYFVAYHAPLKARERLAQATPEQAMAGVQQWIDWSHRLGDKLIDPGKPFGQTMQVTPAGAAPAQSDIVGMSIIEAPDMKTALSLVGDHHHLHWAPGCEISVHEEIAVPEMQQA